MVWLCHFPTPSRMPSSAPASHTACFHYILLPTAKTDRHRHAGTAHLLFLACWILLLTTTMVAMAWEAGVSFRGTTCTFIVFPIPLFFFSSSVNIHFRQDNWDMYGLDRFVHACIIHGLKTLGHLTRQGRFRHCLLCARWRTHVTVDVSIGRTGKGGLEEGQEGQGFTLGRQTAGMLHRNRRTYSFLDCRHSCAFSLSVPSLHSSSS